MSVEVRYIDHQSRIGKILQSYQQLTMNKMSFCRIPNKFGLASKNISALEEERLAFTNRDISSYSRVTNISMLCDSAQVIIKGVDFCSECVYLYKHVFFQNSRIPTTFYKNLLYLDNK